MSEFRADLHCHSLCSDGSDTPFELLTKAKEGSLQGLSITDHDTLAAYTPELFAKAEELSIALLPGVECSSEWEGQVVHILGYGKDLHHPEMISLIKRAQERRVHRNFLIVQKLKAKGMDVEEVLSLPGSIGRPHIAAMLVQKGFLQSASEAFEKYLKEGALCYVSECKLKPLEVMDHLRKASWKSVFAHPHVIEKQKVLHALLTLPWDGLECFYSHLPPPQERAWVRLAKTKGWLVTGGSDYHGKGRSFTTLGCAWVGKEEFDALAT